MYRQYKITFRNNEVPTCWICGKEIDEGSIIEWQRGFQKQLVCDTCLGTCTRNEKNIKILADISIFKHSVRTEE